jgi:RNA polymerase sigma-70 factor (sigma-E family)
MLFEEYVVARGPALARLAYALTGDRHRAEDLVQDTLERVCLNWRRVRKAEQPDAYVRKMLVNQHLSWWRRKRNREVVVSAVTETPVPDPSSAVDDRDQVWKLLSGLPNRQRAVLALRFYADLDDAGIAEILGCSTGTVRSHASRALALLRERLQNHSVEVVR